jgi:SAM-dependent methyltransferase
MPSKMRTEPPRPLADGSTDQGDTDAVPYDPTIYLGSAAHYRYGRPAYSPELEAVLTLQAGLDGSGRLMDAGCGPGVLTVRLAHLFEQAIGLDPDADMLAEGRRSAEEKGIGNIRWVQGLAEDLPAVAPGPYRLVTFGQSFHWTDEQRVAEIVYDLLEPGGALALIVHTVTGRPRPPGPGLPALPHEEIRALVEKYLGSTRRAGQGTFPKRTHRIRKARSLGPCRRSRAHWTPGCSGHRHRQDRHPAAQGPAHLHEPAPCAATWPGASPWRRRKTPPLWWTDGIG